MTKWWASIVVSAPTSPGDSRTRCSVTRDHQSLSIRIYLTNQPRASSRRVPEHAPSIDATKKINASQRPPRLNLRPLPMPITTTLTALRANRRCAFVQLQKK